MAPMHLLNIYSKFNNVNYDYNLSNKKCNFFTLKQSLLDHFPSSVLNVERI